MTPVQPTIDLLRRLPNSVRQGLYAALSVIGLVLAGLDAAGVSDLGPITFEQAFAAYTWVSSAIGVVAVANVNRPEPPDQGVDHHDDVDLSDFEPIGDSEDVYGQAAW